LKLRYNVRPQRILGLFLEKLDDHVCLLDGILFSLDVLESFIFLFGIILCLNEPGCENQACSKKRLKSVLEILEIVREFIS